MRKFLEEIQRRNVTKVALVYIIAGWLTMQVVDVMFPALNLPEWMISAVAAFILIGFPFALIFAWAFEMTPEGIKREKDVDRDASITPATGQKLNHMAMIILAVAVGFLLLDKFVLQLGERPAPDAELAADVRPSIAVLPFVNMSDDEDNEYFSDGLSEELLNLLAKIPRLHVAGRTSSFQFKNTNQDLRVIGERLNVANVLEGSVRKSGTRLRITAQLIDTENGYHLWSETYDRDLTDIFAVQDEIATNVVDALKVTLLGEQAFAVDRGTDNLDAYNEWLKGQYFLDRLTRENLDKAFAAFKKASELDPGFAQAWTGLALAEYNRIAGFVESSGGGFREGFARVRDYAGRAIALDPNNVAAYTAQAMIASGADWDFAGAVSAARKAVELGPNDAGALLWLANLSMFVGDYAESIRVFEKIIDLDPLAIDSLRQLGDVHAVAGHSEEALSYFHRVLELSPDSVRVNGRIASVYLLQGDIDRAAEYTARETVDWTRELYEVLILGRRQGRSSEWLAARDAYIARWGEPNSYQIAEMCADVGDLDCTFEWLQTAVDVHDPGAPWAFIMQYFDEAREDPRWDNFAAAFKY
ncbi:MAG: tetratricopeptide repeat protein [Gammaproteobacteria bacterium]|nr:tetratricopeptide repeat protein [Gammaproteobacteria bacterium]